MKLSDISNTAQIQNQKNVSLPKDEKLWKASKEMEGVFLSILVKAMEKTIPEGSLTGSKNNLSKMMFSTVMGQEMAKNGGIGLADQIYKSLSRKEAQDLEKLKSLDYGQLLQHLKLPGVNNDE